MIENLNADKIKNIKYRPEIDGLRGFAVIAVIINHFNKDILPSGYLGVDIFFVISGYVITSSLFGNNYKNFEKFSDQFLFAKNKKTLPSTISFCLNYFIHNLLIRSHY